MDRPDDPNTIIFNDLLHSFNLRNNISFQTHISGHTLDLILDEQNESLVKCVKKSLLCRSQSGTSDYLHGGM